MVQQTTWAASTYQRKQNRIELRQQKLYADAREISQDMPGIVNPVRRAAALKSLRIFLETYFRKTFDKPWSDDHLKVIERIEAAIKYDRQIALAMPRGSGKTSIVETAVLWAVFNGFRRYPLIVGAAEEQANDILEAIVEELRTNELLLEDFPYECYPFVVVGRQQQKRPLFNKKDIKLKIENGTIVFATIPGSKASGAKIRCVGITGNLRGKKAKNQGENVRVDFVMLDDPQTDEDAESDRRTKQRIKKIKGTILGLAGPGKTLALVACVTVIQPGDLADQLLDHKKNPQFRGMKFQLMASWPQSELWDEYFRIRAEEMLASIDADNQSEQCETPRANALYAANRAEMDLGGEARWTARFNPRRELSAIQHAMNLRQDLGEEQVEAEYQNNPRRETTDNINLKEDEICRRLSHVKRGDVPRTATRLFAGVDCHDRLLYWVVMAVDESFTAWVVDYGTYPGQRVRDFTLRSARNTIAKAHKDITGPEPLHYAAVQATTHALLTRTFKREDGTELQVEKLVIDANWGPMTDTTYLAISQSEHKARILPSHGRGFTESETPISAWTQKAGTKRGDEWILSANSKQRLMKLAFDTNHWKTRFAKALKTHPGSSGALMLCGNDETEHRHIAEHWTSETGSEVFGKRRIHKWKLNPNRENHWLDSAILSLLAASVCGVTPLASAVATKRRSKPKEASYITV